MIVSALLVGEVTNLKGKMDNEAIERLRKSGYSVEFDPGEGTVTVSGLPSEDAGRVLRLEDSSGHIWFGQIQADGVALLVETSFLR